jgi:hypothetical protein
MIKKIVLILGLIIASLSVQLIEAAPWWSFCIVLFVLGIALPGKNWKRPSFSLGFIAGFILWIGMHLYYELVYKGAIMSDISLTFGIPYVLVLLIIGCIGGLLSALSFYSGSLVLQRKNNEFELDD